jgi:hypothetical protein
MIFEADNMIQATLISKEDIPKVKIPNKEVLESNEEILQRKQTLDRAMRMGNNDHNKVKITFQSEDGVMMVETTVWEVTQNYAILKSNTSIPIRSILQIELI